MLIQQSYSVLLFSFQILILQSPYHSLSTELNMGYVKDFFSCLHPINHCSFFFFQLYGGGEAKGLVEGHSERGAGDIAQGIPAECPPLWRVLRNLREGPAED